MDRGHSCPCSISFSSIRSSIIFPHCSGANQKSVSTGCGLRHRGATPENRGAYCIATSENRGCFGSVNHQGPRLSPVAKSARPFCSWSGHLAELRQQNTSTPSADQIPQSRLSGVCWSWLSIREDSSKDRRLRVPLGFARRTSIVAQSRASDLFF